MNRESARFFENYREVGIMKIENDFLFSHQGRTYTWDVYANGDLVAEVQADTASHACDYICRTRWISRHRLSAKPCEE